MQRGVMFPKPVKREAKARKPLRRTWMRKRKPRRLSKASSDPARLAWIRSQPCRFSALAGWGRFCAGAPEAHHAGKKPGLSLKAPDDTAIPLCPVHHRDWHAFTGPFWGMSKLERFAWSVVAIAETQAAYGDRP